LLVGLERRVREHIVDRLRGHQQEVCGLKWSPNGLQLASGGNDNMLNIWELNRERPVKELVGHQAAVKALAWCPWQSSLIASGGGTADRCIKFWNTHTGALLNSIDTHSQVRSRISCTAFVKGLGVSRQQTFMVSSLRPTTRMAFTCSITCQHLSWPFIYLFDPLVLGPAYPASPALLLGFSVAIYLSVCLCLCACLLNGPSVLCR
jgi:WD domain, G-beta repeat